MNIRLGTGCNIWHISKEAVGPDVGKADSPKLDSELGNTLKADERESLHSELAAELDLLLGGW